MMDSESRSSLSSQMLYSLRRAKSSGRSSRTSQEAPLARPITPLSPGSLAAPLSTDNRWMLAHWICCVVATAVRRRTTGTPPAQAA
jgi:hypothetical protein